MLTNSIYERNIFKIITKYDKGNKEKALCDYESFKTQPQFV